ncbi:hypothetical protein [Stutzerimonas nitrititolerans]|uniref:hypothetical protein n=1 Tax=Stutzerimonas nitrititolerans TaxID=2482751 RepID=UPI000F7A3F65|nr:hypothetical protein [Stutzerimonas nitrititolerans]RRV24290.1 hypothetical protein EGJ29_08065 [Pseudomonas sp. s199]
MNDHEKTPWSNKRLLGVIALATLPLWTFVALGTTGGLATTLDGHYHASGQVLLSDGRVIPISQSLVFDKGRFHSMTGNTALIAEASGRVERDLQGRIKLLVEERQISGLSAEAEIDEQLMFNLLYGGHRGAQVTLDQVGACLYGIESRQVYCAEDHPRRDS